MSASTRPSRLLSCTESNKLLSSGLVGVAAWDRRKKTAYLVDGHPLLPAVIEHAESDVLMEHPVTQSDLDNRCDPDAVPLCLLVKIDLVREESKSADYSESVHLCPVHT